MPLLLVAPVACDRMFPLPTSQSLQISSALSCHHDGALAVVVYGVDPMPPPKKLTGRAFSGAVGTNQHAKTREKRTSIVFMCFPC